jgi:hypothetical protein
MLTIGLLSRIRLQIRIRRLERKIVALQQELADAHSMASQQAIERLRADRVARPAVEDSSALQKRVSGARR